MPDAAGLPEYRPPLFFQSPHLQTLFPTLCRPRPFLGYERESVSTGDGDFFDVDLLHCRGSRKLAVLCHGLEGSSRSVYMLGMARALHRAGFHCHALNFRGCGGTPNRKLSSYHSGFTPDLREYLQKVTKEGLYDGIYLVGFSVGGNIILKFLGEEGNRVSSLVKKALVISVPVDLQSSARELARPGNWIYMKRFLILLKRNLVAKQKLYPEDVDLRLFGRIKTFEDYDNRYTAPLFGYRDARDYWRQNSSLFFLDRITVPALLVNALDDPFLGPSCYPAPAKEFSLKTLYPEQGGHTGFVSFFNKTGYWPEQLALRYFARDRLSRDGL